MGLELMRKNHAIRNETLKRLEGALNAVIKLNQREFRVEWLVGLDAFTVISDQCTRRYAPSFNIAHVDEFPKLVRMVLKDILDTRPKNWSNLTTCTYTDGIQ